jgi:hypothetical protein
MAVIAGTETLEAPLDHPREQGEDRTNLIINYLPQVGCHVTRPPIPDLTGHDG